MNHEKSPTVVGLFILPIGLRREYINYSAGAANARATR